eukprot:gene16872-biopygen12836
MAFCRRHAALLQSPLTGGLAGAHRQLQTHQRRWRAGSLAWRSADKSFFERMLRFGRSGRRRWFSPACPPAAWCATSAARRAHRVNRSGRVPDKSRQPTTGNEDMDGRTQADASRIHCLFSHSGTEDGNSPHFGVLKRWPGPARPGPVLWRGTQAVAPKDLRRCVWRRRRHHRCRRRRNAHKLPGNVQDTRNVCMCAVATWTGYKFRVELDRYSVN